MTPEGWAVVIASVLTGIGGVLTAIFKGRQDRDDAALVRLGTVMDRLEKEVSRAKKDIDKLTKDHTSCQVHVASMHGWASQATGLFSLVNNRLSKLTNEEPFALPRIPERPVFEVSEEDKDSMVRQAAQSAAAAQQVKGAVK